MKKFLKPIKTKFNKSTSVINDNMELFTLKKLINTYNLDVLSCMDNDVMVSDLDETVTVFENLSLSYAKKYSKLEVRNGSLKDIYKDSMLNFVADDTKDISSLKKYSTSLDYDDLLYKTLLTGAIRIILVMHNNENYNIYFIDTYDVLTDIDIKYINNVFNRIKKADSSDSHEMQKLLELQHECGLKYNEKLKILKKNQYVINQLAIFNKHFNDLVFATYQLELILN